MTYYQIFVYLNQINHEFKLQNCDCSYLDLEIQDFIIPISNMEY